MIQRIPILTVVAFVVGSVITLKAQIVVDAGGPRNSFYGSTASTNGSTLGLKGLSLKMDTAAQSIEGIYLHPLEANGYRELLWGLDLKFTAVNGVLDLNSWPETDLSAIVNYTSIIGDAVKPEDLWLWSVTLRDTPFYAQDPIFDKSRPSGQQFYKKDAFGNTVAVTFSLVPPGSFNFLGLAISVGYSATNNYAGLPKVTVGKALVSGSTQAVVGSGQTARLGSYETYNAFPLTFLAPINFDAIDGLKAFDKGFSRAAGSLFGLFGSDQGKASYVLLLAPYASVTPRDLGEPLNGLGLNFVIRGLTADPTGINPQNQKLTFPVSIFVERDNAFSGKPSMTVGAGLMFKLF
jgi:hypothetical protein